MKTINSRIGLIVIVLCTTTIARGAAPKIWQVGVRQHVEHTEFTDLPFDDSLSYGGALAFRANNALWQFAVDYAPDAKEGISYVVTPQINLLLTDKSWRAGTGLLASYVGSEIEGVSDDWTDLYWQLMLGYAIPVGPFTVEAYAFYTYEDWGAITDFDFDDLEYGAWVGYQF